MKTSKLGEARNKVVQQKALRLPLQKHNEKASLESENIIKSQRQQRKKHATRKRK